MNETIDSIIEDITDVADDIQDTTGEVVQNDDTTEAIDEVAGQQDERNTPEDWEQGIKDFIDGDVFKDNLDGRGVFFDKFKSILDDQQGKYRTMSEDKKTFEADKASFEDNRNLRDSYKALEEESRLIDSDLFNRETAKHGGTNNYYKALHQVSSDMAKDPLGTMLRMMDGYQITPEMLTNGSQDPSYQARQSNMQSQNDMEKFKQEAKAEFKQEMEDYKATQNAEAIFTAKDDNGNLKYPNLEQIQDDVAGLMETKRLGIDEAYAMAKLMNPEVFKSELSQKAEIQAKNEELDRAKTVKGVKASPKSANANKSNLSIDEIIAEELEKGGKRLD